MPHPKSLKVGSRIRILSVPACDLRLRESTIASGVESAECTADSIELIIAQTPIVQISHIDEDNSVWYETTIVGHDGIEETHWLMVYDDDSWELVVE